MPTTTVAAAIELFKTYTLGQFDSAYQSATATTPPREPTDADKELRKAQASAVGQMASSLQQLVQMQKLAGSVSPPADPGRDAIVLLMKEIQATAQAVCHQVRVQLAPVADATEEAARLRRLSSLAGVLDALARISPIAVWEQPPAPSSGS